MSADHQPVGLTRRDFLRLGLPVGVALVEAPALLLAAACSKAPSPVRTSPPVIVGQRPEGVKVIEIGSGNQRLIDEIDRLPSSLVRSLLQERVSPFYRQSSDPSQPAPPSSIKYPGDIEIRVKSPTVTTITTNEQLVRVDFNLRKKDQQKEPQSEPHYLFKTASLSFPFPGIIVLPNETGPGAYLADGTFFVGYNYTFGQPIYEGISPTINISYAHPDFVKQGEAETQELFKTGVFIREACVHLMYSIWLDEITAKMNAFGMNPFLEVMEKDGTVSKREGISDTLISVLRHNSNSYMVPFQQYQLKVDVTRSKDGGRARAAIELGSILLAFKALDGTDALKIFTEQNNVIDLPAQMRGVDIGDNPKDILFNSLKWAINAPEAKLFLPLTDASLDLIP